MAIVTTVWRARRAKRGDPSRILCGRMVGGRHVCPEVVAYAFTDAGLAFRAEQRRRSRDATNLLGPLVSAAGGRIDRAWVEPLIGKFTLPAGLTDEGTPGRYRWSEYALERERRGEELEHLRGSRNRIRTVEIADLPITVPCKRHHDNLVDEAVLGA